MRNEEFIRLDGQAVRLTSISRQDDALALVVIVRGGSNRDELQALLARPSFMVSLGDEPERRMHTASIDLRSSGEGSTSVHRFAITLEPATDESPSVDLGEAQTDLLHRLSRIERKLDAILARLDSGNAMPF